MEMAEAPVSSPALAGCAAPLLLAAKLFTADGRMLVTVLALDAGHAVVTTAAAPPAGSVAVLARRGARAAAEVAWVDERRVGLAFYEPLDGGVLTQLAE